MTYINEVYFCTFPVSNGFSSRDIYNIIALVAYHKWISSEGQDFANIWFKTNKTFRYTQQDIKKNKSRVGTFDEINY